MWVLHWGGRNNQNFSNNYYTYNKNEYWINKVVLQELAYAHVILLPVLSWVRRIEFL